MAKSKSSAPRQAFFVSRIGPPRSEIRFHSDVILKLVVEPAAKMAGLTGAVRADQEGRPGRITDRVLEHLVDGAAVVADLTGSNPNVFYEVAVAHAVRTPIVHIIDVKEIDSLPFDIRDQATVTYRTGDTDDYSRVAEQVAGMLKGQLKEGQGPENPLTTYASRISWLKLAEAEGDGGTGDSFQKRVIGELIRIGQKVDELDSNRGIRLSSTDPNPYRIDMTSPNSGITFTDPGPITIRSSNEPLFTIRGIEDEGEYVGDGTASRHIATPNLLFPSRIQVVRVDDDQPVSGVATGLMSGFTVSGSANQLGVRYRFVAQPWPARI